MSAASQKMEADLKTFKSAYVPAFTKLRAEHEKLSDATTQQTGENDAQLQKLESENQKLHTVNSQLETALQGLRNELSDKDGEIAAIENEVSYSNNSILNFN